MTLFGTRLCIIVSTVRVVSKPSICRTFVLTVIGSWIVGIVSRFIGIVSGLLAILQDVFVGLTVLTMLTVSCRLFLHKGLQSCSLTTAAALAVLDADLAQGGR